MICKKTIHIYEFKFILVIIYLLPLSGFATGQSFAKDTLVIKQYIDKAKFFNTPNKETIDSTLFYINKAQVISKELDCSKYLFTIDKLYVEFFMNTKNYSMALDYSFKMMRSLENKEYAEEHNIVDINYQHIILYTSIGIIYINLGDFEKSLNYLSQAEKLAIENYQIDRKEGAKLCVIYNDIGAVYLQQGKCDIALGYYEKALEYNKINEDEAYHSAILNNLGIIKAEQGEYGQALDYYEQSLALREKLNDKEGIAQVYNNIGGCYIQLSKINKAIDFFYKSIALCQETNNYRSEMIAVRSLAMLYNFKKRYEDEAIMSRREIDLKDSIAFQQNKAQVVKLEAQYQYEKQRKQDELQQEILLAKKEKNTLIFIMITGVLSFSFFILILFYRNLKIKAREGELQSESLILKGKNLELEKQNLLLRNSKLEQEVENKNKELTTHVMYLMQKNEFIAFVTDRLSELAESDSKQISKQRISSIIRQMKSNVDKTTWDEFEIRFQQIHQNFYTNLNERIPNLTPNERRLCAFLYLNMTTKEISSVTFQSVKSIEVARTRLRKKLQLEGDNLISYLQSL